MPRQFDFEPRQTVDLNETQTDKNKFQVGDLVLLIDRKDRRYMITLVAGETYHCHLGQLSHDKIIGNNIGGWFRTDKGHILLGISPSLGDFVRQMPRGPQIVYPKDLGNIVNFADIFPGATVIEGGLGSGALTSALLRAVGNTGKVINYEIDDAVLPKALRNIERINSDTSNLEVKISNIYEGISERNVDRVVLDVPEPWQALKGIGDALVMGGIMLSFVPTIIQVQKLVLAMEEDGRFQMIESMETLLRTWHVTERSVRPDHRMIAHSGFLTTAVRCDPKPYGRVPPPTSDDLEETSLEDDKSEVESTG
ncbi:MAG: tRNA (adenine-N1)-methyltransferase [Dehalococcoidia bacterium]|nr:tRNA (adenine-N1)-methyltransferase [Dehalococcoidia bacterium]